MRGKRRDHRRGALARAAALVALVALVAGGLLGLAGCGSHEAVGNRIRGHVLTIYTSLPLTGLSTPGATAVLNAERLALAQQGGRIGPYRIVLRVLDDATAARDSWDPGQATIDVHLAAQDPTSIGYVGDFDSGATAISIPPLNRVGIAQVSPTASAVGLTSDGPGSSPGEPAKYYPTGHRTFVALAPDDAVQAEVQLRLQQSLGCRRTFVLYDDEDVDGYDAAASFQAIAQTHGYPLAGATGFDPRATDYSSLATSVAHTGADCVLVSSLPSTHSSLLTRQLGRAMPSAWIFGIGDLAEPAFVDPEAGGIPLGLDPRVLIVTGGVDESAAGARFVSAYTVRYGDPGPYAAYGYEAMRMLLGAISQATGHGRHVAVRSQVVAALLRTQAGPGALGPFSVAGDGSTSLQLCAVYRVVGGQLVRWFQARG